MNTARAFTITLALFLIVEGVLGFFRPMVFGVLSTNLLHATIHVVLGVVGLLAARTGHARGYLLFVGILLLTVGVLWWVPQSQPIIVNLLSVNRAVAVLNIAVGAVALLVSRMAK